MMWKDLNLSLFDIFCQGNNHWAMKFYYLNECEQLINPALVFDVLDYLKKITPPVCY